MAIITDRVLTLLRALHGGARLRVLPNGTAMLDLSHVAPGVRRATVEKMEDAGLIVRDITQDRYDITEAGRDQVRVRDGIDDLVDTAPSTAIAS